MEDRAQLQLIVIPLQTLAVLLALVHAQVVTLGPPVQKLALQSHVVFLLINFIMIDLHASIKIFIFYL